MSLIVQKFGGSSVRDDARLLRAMELASAAWERGDDVVVVLSARGEMTDELLASARALSHDPQPRELDALLATGETASVALGAVALRALGVPSVSLSCWQLPLETDGVHGNAAVTRVGTARLRQELAARRVVLVAGFQGVDAAGDVTTLGRGGSDTSAVALASALDAARCVIYTDVDGVFTADPRVCPAARRLPEISYEEMYRLAASGARVLHDRSVALAASCGVALEVRACTESSVGTRITADAPAMPLVGVTRRTEASGATCFTVVGSALEEAERVATEALRQSGASLVGIERERGCLRLRAACPDADASLRALHAALFERRALARVL